jgi:hypothetical protein
MLTLAEARITLTERLEAIAQQSIEGDRRLENVSSLWSAQSAKFIPNRPPIS